MQDKNKIQATSSPEAMPKAPSAPAPPAGVPTNSLDLVALLKDGRHFAEHRGGHTHIIDSLTGVSIAVLAQDPRTALSARLIPVESPTGGVTWVQEGVKVPTVSSGTEYNPLVLDIVCQKISEGKNITAVCKEEGMPTYNTLCRWRRMYPEVDRALELARRDRAESLRDKVLARAEQVMENNTDSKGDVAALGVLLDATKWAAAVDSEKYNPKAKVEATVNIPTIIQVNTGIVRE